MFFALFPFPEFKVNLGLREGECESENFRESKIICKKKEKGN